jgi:threonine aldolase
MFFASDNWAGVAPAVLDAIAGEAALFGNAYGESATDRSVAELFNQLFEREVAVFPVATGSAANTLALAAVNKPGGVVFCHRESHIIEDECGGLEYLTGGARALAVDGSAGKIDPGELKDAIARFGPQHIHAGQPMAISLTEMTESGTVYSVEEVEALATIAHAHGLPVHMDGARFANALAHLDVSPAELTWNAGVDMLSFGGTKNGCMAAEAIVFFDPGMARQAPYLRKRAGQLFSKSRFIAAQFEAYLRDGLWLELARHANAMADRLRVGLASDPGAQLAWPTHGNEVFAVLENGEADRLRRAGAVFHEWMPPHGAELGLVEGEGLFRLVTSFATREEDVDGFLALFSGHSRAERSEDPRIQVPQENAGRYGSRR